MQNKYEEASDTLNRFKTEMGVTSKGYDLIAISKQREIDSIKLVQAGLLLELDKSKSTISRLRTQLAANKATPNNKPTPPTTVVANFLRDFAKQEELINK